jgi:hypothetical protein
MYQLIAGLLARLTCGLDSCWRLNMADGSPLLWMAGIGGVFAVGLLGTLIIVFWPSEDGKK